MIKKELNDIININDISSFWELVKFLIIDGYSEYDSIVTATHYFDGDMWSRVIGVSEVDSVIFSDSDTLIIFILNKNIDIIYKPIYLAYIKTMKYELIPELEKNITTVELELKTNLAIELINNGVKKI
jgi:hypothetical protein